MANVPLLNQRGESLGTMTLPDAVFAVPVNMELLAQVIAAQEANQRQGTAHSKGRGEVRGGGKKPWRQKGTGRARHGSIRSPIWKGGGATHGPTSEKDYTQKINRRMALAALRSILSGKVRDAELVVVDAFAIPEAKTKEAVSSLRAVIRAIPGVRATDRTLPKALVILPGGEGHTSVVRALRNVPRAEVESVRNVQALSVADHQYIIVHKDAVDALVARMGSAA
ncbi:MAG: 50S ribosomal protein L4 [Candidatus Paceibacterota bacterium]|nr:MAG: 50S ribosomal protein L4 [Candidatus Paceibacterota bacterium]